MPVINLDYPQENEKINLIVDSIINALMYVLGHPVFGLAKALQRIKN
jgi:hypothetical protein